MSDVKTEYNPSKFKPEELSFPKEEERKKIMIKIDWEKAKQMMSKPESFSVGSELLYKQDVGSGLEFVVVKSDVFLAFKVVPQDNYTIGCELADFVFCLEGLEEGAVELSHRIVKDSGREAGISGGNVLQEAEEYMRIFLLFHGLEKKYNEFYISSTQLDVVEWAINDRNNYHFKNPADKGRFLKILENRGQDYFIGEQRKKTNDGREKKYIYTTRVSDDGHIVPDELLKFELVKNIWPKEEKRD